MARFITAGGLLALAQTVAAVPLEERFVSDATTTISSAAATIVPVVPVTDVTSHGPYTGPSPTTTGALSTSVLASSIPALPAESSKYDYPADVCIIHNLHPSKKSLKICLPGVNLRPMAAILFGSED